LDNPYLILQKGTRVAKTNLLFRAGKEISPVGIYYGT
jgi:hypothetical protein